VNVGSIAFFAKPKNTGCADGRSRFPLKRIFIFCCTLP